MTSKCNLIYNALINSMHTTLQVPKLKMDYKPLHCSEQNTKLNRKDTFCNFLATSLTTGTKLRSMQACSYSGNQDPFS